MLVDVQPPNNVLVRNLTRTPSVLLVLSAPRVLRSVLVYRYRGQGWALSTSLVSSVPYTVQLQGQTNDFQSNIGLQTESETLLLPQRHAGNT